MSNSLLPHWLYSPWNSPGWNTGMGSLSLFQGIFPAQELNQGLLHCRQILYQLSYQEICPGNKNCLWVHATRSFLSCILNLGCMLESPGELKKSPHSQSAGFPGGVSGKEPTCQCRRWEVDLIPGSGRSPGGGHANPLQYSYLENPMDRRAWWATVHGVAKSQTWLKWLSMNARTQAASLTR